ncbi:S1 RNA-binding domain-containing protein, partial [Enterocloster bolteae]
MATKKKELLEQDAPVTETVMSEGETLLADTAQPESLPADAGDGLDLNELLGQMDQPQEDTSAEDMAEDPLPELTEEEMFGDTPAETDDQSTAPTDMPEDSDVQPPDVYENNADAVQEAPAPPKPKRTSRKKKEAAAPEKTVTEEVPAETTESADTADTILDTEEPAVEP